jgi:hypothetical protein
MKKCVQFAVQRLEGNPIIYPDMPGLQGELGVNINGPALIRVPAWIQEPLGKYYLYFAHHGGAYIRMAYADALQGPWTVYAPGVLHMDQGPGRKHIASPDVHIDHERQQIRLYFHQPAPETQREMGQLSYLALTSDGLNFKVQNEVLGRFYFRVFAYDGWHYALAKGISYRSRDGLTDFVEGPVHLPRCRHTALWVEGDRLHVIYSRTEDRPESLLYTHADLRGDWQQWTFAEAELLLKPELEWEGADCPLETSRKGRARKRMNELRDPGMYQEDGQRYLLYSIAGESGIALARLLDQV